MSTEGDVKNKKNGKKKLDCDKELSSPEKGKNVAQHHLFERSESKMSIRAFFFFKLTQEFGFQPNKLFMAVDLFFTVGHCRHLVP